MRTIYIVSWIKSSLQKFAGKLPTPGEGSRVQPPKWLNQQKATFFYYMPCHLMWMIIALHSFLSIAALARVKHQIIIKSIIIIIILSLKLVDMMYKSLNSYFQIKIVINCHKTLTIIKWKQLNFSEYLNNYSGLHIFWCRPSYNFSWLILETLNSKIKSIFNG